MSVAIIGGTGIGSKLSDKCAEAKVVGTRFGEVTYRRHPSGTTIVARHGEGHKVPPHKVNYRALALGLQTLGCRYCLSSAAVGSLREDWEAGTIAVVSDFIDLTGRELTLFDTEIRHTDFSAPFSSTVRNALIGSAKAEGVQVRDSAVYVGGNGPRYETAAEIQAYRSLGGDIVGMTASSEAIVMREAGVEYACLAIVTNLGTGLAHAELTHAEVEEQMARSADAAIRILLGAAKALANS
jgi:5'-methylthioadenosine phosphorylase